MSSSSKKQKKNGDDLVDLYNLLFKERPIVGMKTLAQYIIENGLNQNSRYLSNDDGTVSYEKLLLGLSYGFHMRNPGNTDNQQLQISVNDLRDFMYSLENMSLSFDDENLRAIFQRVLTQEAAIEQQHYEENEYLQKRHASKTAIQHDASCFRGTDESPASTIVIAVCMHGADENRKYESSLVAAAFSNEDVPQQKHTQLHHYTSVPCGYPNKSMCGKVTNNVETMEAVLQLRSETQPKIDYVSTKMDEYAERNADFFHSGQKLYHTEFEGLKQSDFFACGVPVYDRLFQMNPLERDFPYGARVLSWCGNEKVDPILEGLASKNYLDPDVSSVHLVDNAHVILKDWQQKRGLPPMGCDITKSLEQNFKDNDMTDLEYEKYKKDNANRFNPLFELDNRDFNGFYHEPSPHPIREELEKITTLNDMGQHEFTLIDLTNFAGGLGYEHVVVIDTGCRIGSDFSNHQKAVEDYNQTPYSKTQGEKRKRFGGEHKKSKRKRKYLVIITSKTHKGRRLKNKSRKHKNKKATRR